MTTDPRILRAASNNADWYDIMAAAHGIGVHRDALALTLTGDPPPYHGHMVTLEPDPMLLLPRITGLTDMPGFAFKDSFACIDGTALGLSQAITGTWFWATGHQADLPDGWDQITTTAALSQWETAWKADGSPTLRQQFPDSLLARSDIQFWGHRGAAGYDAGGVLNISADCVGLTNFFGPDPFDALLRIAARCGKPTVGYAYGARQADVAAAGCRLIGPMRVWARA